MSEFFDLGPLEPLYQEYTKILEDTSDDFLVTTLHGAEDKRKQVLLENGFIDFRSFGGTIVKLFDTILDNSENANDLSHDEIADINGQIELFSSLPAEIRTQVILSDDWRYGYYQGGIFIKTPLG